MNARTYYYIHYYRNFANTYNLYHAPAGVAVPEEWERIPRREALHKAANADDFGSSLIMPHDLREDEDIYSPRRFEINGRIIKRRPRND